MLYEKNYDILQELVDRNHNVYALVITDCTNDSPECSGQKIIIKTTPSLIRNKPIFEQDLIKYGYFVLRKPQLTTDSKIAGNGPKHSEIIGRVYSISTIPSFSEDHGQWLKTPFVDNELWRKYLINVASCLLGALFLWSLIELVLKIRRVEKQNSKLREGELISKANSLVTELNNKQYIIEENEKRHSNQFSTYVLKMKALEKKLADVVEYKDIADLIIKDLEDERDRQSNQFKSELERINNDKISLQREIAKFESARANEKSRAKISLEKAISPQFSDHFEKTLFDIINKSPKYIRGEWRIISNFDVGISKSNSQFIDMIVITKDCLTVIEAKNYSGKIEPEGDVENSQWFCDDGTKRHIPVKSAWGDNPYHQVREYSMSLMHLVQRSNWLLPVYGLILFPDDSDLSLIEKKIGKYYRITTAMHLVGTIEQIDAEARRGNSFTKRPTPEQIENLIRGKA